MVNRGTLERRSWYDGNQDLQSRDRSSFAESMKKHAMKRKWHNLTGLRAVETSNLGTTGVR